jgi:N-(2-amino-2-carboxyethyl)-L-glutamate synthase
MRHHSLHNGRPLPNVATRVDALIGNTPLLRLGSVSDPAARIGVYGKLEAFNPGTSVKDRSALQLIEQAKIDFHLAAGWTIVESTSGNMGHALAMLCAINGYRFVCVLDPKTPKSNIKLVRAYGGEVEMVDTPDADGSFQKKRIALAKAIARQTPDCVNLDQYNNPAAIDAHFKSTGPEIYAQTGGDVDVLIGSASTGSHLSGTAKFLKMRNPKIWVIGVEPVGSVVFGGEYRPFLQNGLGLSFTPRNILMSHIDEVIKVRDIDAFAACRRLARADGLLLGGSSGAVLHAANEYIAGHRSPSNIVVVLPDTGLKYLDTIYDDAWLQSHNLGGLVVDRLLPTSRVVNRRYAHSTDGHAVDSHAAHTIP